MNEFDRWDYGSGLSMARDDGVCTTTRRCMVTKTKLPIMQVQYPSYVVLLFVFHCILVVAYYPMATNALGVHLPQRHCHRPPLSLSSSFERLTGQQPHRRASFFVCWEAVNPFDVAKISNDDGDTDDDDDEIPLGLANELEDIQYQLSLIEALEERNRAQLDSFVDENDQWESMEEHERQLLLSKETLEQRLEEILSDWVNSWVGRKSLEG